MAIEIETELRIRGVSIKNMKGTQVHFAAHGRIKTVTTGVHLERKTTGWFVTGIEKLYSENGKCSVSTLTPQAADDIIRYKIDDTFKVTVHN